MLGNQQQAPSVARIVRPTRATIQWNDALDVVPARHERDRSTTSCSFLAESGSLVDSSRRYRSSAPRRQLAQLYCCHRRHGSRFHPVRDGHERERGRSVDGGRGC